MAASAMGIWNHLSAAGHTLKGAIPTNNAANESSGSSTANSDSATISANDFLTLLVTEMQNQDPTANTDPNEYINQLVQVNSLEQLISINQTLTADSSSSTTPSNAAATAAGKPAGIAAQATGIVGSTSANGLHTGVASGVSTVIPTRHAPGNLTIPQANPAAERVARSLAGQSRPA